MTNPPDRHHVLRILDANFNRAREALRVMEEYARLVLEDAALVSDLKQTRHDLASCVDARLMHDMLAARDIVGDVGCDISTPSEFSRTDSTAVARAAGKRLGEALRSIEEFGKTLPSLLAATVEKIRYRAYDLERRMGRLGMARDRMGHVRLYVLLTESLCRGDWLATAEAVLRGGADVLQLREKSLPDGELLKRAKQLALLASEHQALLIINDRTDIAALSGAHGVHLGQDDITVAQARRLLPPDAVVGISTHNLAQVEAAIAEGPDYLAVGPMFPSSTKPQEEIPGLALLGRASRLSALPLMAIGGIDLANSGEVLATAPCALCVCQAIIAHANAEERTAAFRAALCTQGGG